MQRPITTWINNRTSVLNPGILNGSVHLNNIAPCPTFERIKVPCSTSNRTFLKEEVSSFCNNDNLIKVSSDVEKDSEKSSDKRLINLCSLNAQSVCKRKQRISLY